VQELNDFIVKPQKLSLHKTHVLPTLDDAHDALSLNDNLRYLTWGCVKKFLLSTTSFHLLIILLLQVNLHAVLFFFLWILLPF